MIIHISRQRFDFIKSLGYSLGSRELVNTVDTLEVDNVYHLLDDEYGYCKECQAPFDSIDANSPSELETVKLCLEFNRDPAEALKVGRQAQQLLLKQLLEKGHSTHG